MRHAYLIIAHNEPAVLRTLLTLLDDVANDVFLHIDRKAVVMRSMFEKWNMHQATLFLLDDPIDVRWGDISQVDVELKLFRTAHEVGGYDYYHLLSGSDLPLRPQQEIKDFFAAHAGKEFVHFWRSKSHARDLRRKVTRYYLFTQHAKTTRGFKRRVTTPVRNVVLAVQKLTGFRRRQEWHFCKGSNWVSITADFCDYLLVHAESIRRRMRYVLCPDEIFLQTVLWNSPFRERLYSEADDVKHTTQRLIDWQRGCPYVWKDDDFEELMSSEALFARKFSDDTPELLRRIQERVQAVQDIQEK